MGTSQQLATRTMTNNLFVTIERGMYVGQNDLVEVAADTDANGIAILRYRFKHVAAPPP